MPQTGEMSKYDHWWNYNERYIWWREEKGFNWIRISLKSKLSTIGRANIGIRFLYSLSNHVCLVSI